MTPAPRKVQTSGSMPQIMKPKMVTQIKRVYWRGETTTACAICSDFITKNSAVPARAAKTKKRKIWVLSVIGVQAQGWNKTKIKTLVYAVKKAVVKGSSVEAINLDIIWRNAKSNAAIIINTWPRLIISNPGLIIIRVPENPMITASQRLIPIGSFRIK